VLSYLKQNGRKELGIGMNVFTKRERRIGESKISSS
jgi:hypothetical protein